MRRLSLCFGLLLASCIKPDHIELEPGQVTLTRRGDQLWVHALYKDGQGKQYTREHGTWSSSDEKVVKVDSVQRPGNLLAVGPGHATVTVKSDDGLVAEVPVEVVTVEKLKVSPQPITLTEDGERVLVQVQALDVDGHPLKDRKAHLKCTNEKICNSDGDGVWPAGDPGTTTLEVSLDEHSLTVPVTVLAAKGGKKK